MIHHTLHPNKVFENLTSFMHKETELRVMLYSKISWKLFWVMLENDFKSLKNTDDGCPIAYTYTFEDIDKLISPYNLKLQNIWKDHIFMYDIEAYKENIYKLDKYWNETSEKFRISMTKELGWHTLFIAKLEK